MGTGEFSAGVNPAMDWHPIQGGVEILLVASCYRNRDKLQPDEPLGSARTCADFTFVICTLIAGRITIHRRFPRILSYCQEAMSSAK